MKMEDLPPNLRKQVEGIFEKDAKDALPKNLEAAKEMCDLADSPKMEKELLKLCMSDLSRWGVEFFHAPTMVKVKAGWPDLTFCFRSRFFGLELKRKNGVVSEDQKRVLANMEQHGGIVAIIRTHEQFRNIVLNTME
jgi:hypothetical protein